MPFVNQGHRYTRVKSVLDAGRKPIWNCSKREKETKKICGVKCIDGRKCTRMVNRGGRSVLATLV
jgi:hypothetical protein